MFGSSAFAQAAGGGAGGAAGGGDFITGILPLVLIFVVFYFLLIRPQQKRMKDHKAKVSAMRRGDRVVTGGGIIGVITKVVSDTEVQVEIAEGVKVKVARSTISDVISKSEPAADKKAQNKDKSDPPERKSLIGRIMGGGS